MAGRYAAEPIHMDEYGGIHYPPQPQPDAYTQAQPPSPPGASTPRPRRPRYDGADRDRPRPRRAHTYRAPPPPSSPSSTTSPPRRSPRNHDRTPQAQVQVHPEDYYAPRPHHRRRHTHREDAYLSDSAHDRRSSHRHGDHEDRSHYHQGPREHRRDDGRRARPRAERKESKWQKEGKKLFNEYAVPAIKAEGTKFVTKQIGNILAKRVG